MNDTAWYSAAWTLYETTQTLALAVYKNAVNTDIDIWHTAADDATADKNDTEATASGIYENAYNNAVLAITTNKETLVCYNLHFKPPLL